MTKEEFIFVILSLGWSVHGFSAFTIIRNNRRRIIRLNTQENHPFSIKLHIGAFPYYSYLDAYKEITKND